MSEPTIALVRQNWPLIIAFLMGLWGYASLTAKVEHLAVQMNEVRAERAVSERDAREMRAVSEREVRDVLVAIAGLKAEVVALRDELRRRPDRAERAL